MYGLNAFLDNDFTGGNRRWGMGAEYWRDYLKLSANGYLRISDWHQSYDVVDYDERPANGFDLRAEVYLPGQPQLSAKIVYEQYYGNEVALFGNDSREKNPKAATVGMNYTPVPLVTFGVDFRDSQKGGNHDTILGMQVNYDIGVPLGAQLDPGNVALSRTLAGSRMDLVARNNNIVLEYRKQDFIRANINELLRGASETSVPVHVGISSKYGISHISWSGDVLTQPGVKLVSAGSSADGSDWILRLPMYLSGQVNTYALTATAYDTHNNSASPVSARVVVEPLSVSPAKSSLKAAPATIFANGSAKSMVTFIAHNTSNIPIDGLNVTFSQQGTPVTLSEVTAKGNGEYTATLSGTQAGTVALGVSVDGAKISGLTATVTLTAGSVDPGKSTLKAVPATLVANGTDKSKLTVMAVDTSGNAVTGANVTFKSDDVVSVTIGSVTETSPGVYQATLTSGIQAGAVVISAVVGGTTVNETANVTLTADSVDPAKSTLVAVPAQIKADNKEESVVRFTAKGANGNAIDGLNVTFSATGVSVGLGAVQAKGNGVYELSLKGALPGAVQVSVAESGQSVALAPAEVTLISAFSLSTLTVTADNAAADGTATNAVKAHVVDSGTQPVSGKTVSFSATNGAIITTADVQTDTNGDASTTLTSLTVGVSQVTATLNGGSGKSVSVTFTDTIRSFESISVNGATYNAGGRFPQTGFSNASFTLKLDKRLSSSDFDWSTDNGAVSVDGAGLVTLLSEPAGPVTVTAKSKVTPSLKFVFTMNLSKWFIDNGTDVSLSAAVNWCASQGYIAPAQIILTTAPSGEIAQRASDGTLWDEWGNLTHYKNGGMSSGYHWAGGDIITAFNADTLSFTSGQSTRITVSGGKAKAVCYKAL